MACRVHDGFGTFGAEVGFETREDQNMNCSRDPSHGLVSNVRVAFMSTPVNG